MMKSARQRGSAEEGGARQTAAAAEGGARQTAAAAEEERERSKRGGGGGRGEAIGCEVRGEAERIFGVQDFDFYFTLP